jgi:type I restriction enzyme M protein
MAKRKNGNGNENRRLATQQSVDQAVKNICDIMRRGNCAGAMQYVPELTWILFLRILDEKEYREEQELEALGVAFRPSLEAPFRWRDWATPPEKLPEGQTNKRVALQNSPQNAFFNFVNMELLPHLKGLKNRPDASPRQKVISEIMTGVERVRIDTERNFLDVLDKVDQLTAEAVDPTHVFTLSQVYEGLLLKMGEKGNDGGQFFTPRQVIKAMVQIIDPKVDETIYDPGCGTGGFLAQSFEHIIAKLGDDATAEQLDTLKQRTFWGREKENLVYPIALANLVLHGIDKPNLWHGNALTGRESYGGLFEDAPEAFDVILTNPPFGGKEGKEAQTNFDYKTSATQALFLQHVIRALRDGGRCGIVLDEGFLFRTNEDAFVKTKRKLLDDCDLWCVVSLPAGVFTAAGAGVKTNLLFFTKGQTTRRIWYHDLSELKIRKKTPLMLKHFEEFMRLLSTCADSDVSWTVDMDQRKRTAVDEARPLKEQAAVKSQQAAQWSQRVSDLKKTTPRDNQAIDEAETTVRELTRESRDFAAKAKEIEDAVYDLKAVNPHRRPVVDTRTADELMNIIEAKGREIADVLGALRMPGSKNIRLVG